MVQGHKPDTYSVLTMFSVASD